MSARGQLAGLLGVFAGGALPWLEAVIVIPGGILAGLDPLAVFLAAVVGNLSTVALAAWGGDRLRTWWTARRRRRRADRVTTAPAPATTAPPQGDPPTPSRAQRVVDRWGLPGLAILGPLALGTQASVLVALGLGTPARRAFTWIAAGTVGWAAVAAIAATAGAGALFG